MRMSPGLVIVFLFVLFVVPVCGAQNSTNVTVTANTTAVTTTAAATVATTQVSNTTVTTTPVTNTTTVPVTTTVPPVTTTPAPVTTTAVPVTTEPTAAPATGDVSVASTPLGASILIDGTYYGTTPVKLTGIPAGNHILRLSLSGYYDYEGTLYVIPGQITPAFGNLPPLGYNPVPSQTVTTPSPTTLAATAAPETPQPTPTPAPSPLENPSVVAAILGGSITAIIGAAATILTHVWKKN